MASFVIAAASRFDASAPGPLPFLDARVRSPARSRLVGRLHRGHEHVDRIRPGGGIAPQVEIGRNRLDGGAAEIHRVEIESQEIEQR
jgi:hypothetical protein